MGQPAPSFEDMPVSKAEVQRMHSEQSGDWVKDIADMHDKFGVNTVIRNLDKEKLRTFLKFRIDFLQEELDEMRDALDNPEFAKDRGDETVDALIDLCVVAIGTLNAFDVNSHEAWNRVHEKNMQKSAGVNANRPNPLGLPDLIKPTGWTAPTHADNVGLLKKVFE
jgi:predicted HAD superfamily Cof-like phosphohydrolase